MLHGRADTPLERSGGFMFSSIATPINNHYNPLIPLPFRFCHYLPVFCIKLTKKVSAALCFKKAKQRCNLCLVICPPRRPARRRLNHPKEARTLANQCLLLHNLPLQPNATVLNPPTLPPTPSLLRRTTHHLRSTSTSTTLRLLLRRHV